MAVMILPNRAKYIGLCSMMFHHDGKHDLQQGKVLLSDQLHILK
jgi:hypothetical protein